MLKKKFSHNRQAIEKQIMHKVCLTVCDIAGIEPYEFYKDIARSKNRYKLAWAKTCFIAICKDVYQVRPQVLQSQFIRDDAAGTKTSYWIKRHKLLIADHPIYKTLYEEVLEDLQKVRGLK